MGKNPNEYETAVTRVVRVLEDVARAIREQTEYFREDDRKDAEPMPSDDKEEGDTMRGYDSKYHLVDEARGPMATVDEDGRVRTVSWTRGEDSPEPETPVFIIQLMRETPHAFTPKKRSYAGLSYGRRAGRSSAQECRLCDLTFRNPVHLIQMASLTED